MGLRRWDQCRRPGNSGGGFDPFVGIFAGTGPTAAIENTAGGTVTYGTADTLSNYGSFMACPPAGLATIGAITGQCGDVLMSLSLPAGTYTVLVTDGLYYPNAVFDNGKLSEGFKELTGGSFPLQTRYDATDYAAANRDRRGPSLDRPRAAVWELGSDY